MDTDPISALLLGLGVLPVLASLLMIAGMMFALLAALAGL